MSDTIADAIVKVRANLLIILDQKDNKIAELENKLAERDCIIADLIKKLEALEKSQVINNAMINNVINDDKVEMEQPTESRHRRFLRSVSSFNLRDKNQ